MDVLACPHCDRMFHATPSLLGKAIRCRECRKTFRVPADLTTAEFGPEPETPQPEILIAVECVVQGVDARRCPACSHTFSMQTKFIGKRIRCRGCRELFVVLASTQAVGEPATTEDVSEGGFIEDPPNPAHVSTPPSLPDPESHLEPEAADDSASVIHEDGGDVLAVEPAGDPLVVAVRPRACWRARMRYEPVRGPFRSGRF